MIRRLRAYDARGTKKTSPPFLVDRRRWHPAPNCASGSAIYLIGFADFRKRYLTELDAHWEFAQPILDAAGRVVLLYSAKDTERNQAVVIQE